jgi:uncharacterized protein (TIGR00730 family)
MKSKNDKGTKLAYEDKDFINSSEARTVRVLSEFIRPQKSFRDFGIKNTIVFFGSARVNAKGSPLSKYYRDAVELSEKLTAWAKKNSKPNEQNYVICSGGGPGLMEAANLGAKKAGGVSVGLNISLPFEQQPNPYITKDLTYTFHYFFIRKFWFAYLAKCLIVFPGGYGTFDELFEILTLVQTHKKPENIPIVLYGSEYWKKIINFDEMIKLGVIDEHDYKLFKMIDNVDKAYDYITKQLEAINGKL